MAINGLGNALTAIQRQSAALDRAAEKLTRAAATDITDVPSTQAEAEAVSASEAGLVDGSVELMVASRMFTAAIKVAQTTNEGILEALKLGGYANAA